ncbi:hypothetical protein BKC07_14215 [Peribacillus simplex]|nr:hypothetical protein BKC07_14215 [Peribacillus simplex]
MFPLRSESIHKAWKEPIFLTKKALFVKIIVFKTTLFKVDWSGSARLPAGAAGQVKTPQGLRRGCSPPRGKRASGGEINHSALLGK